MISRSPKAVCSTRVSRDWRGGGARGAEVEVEARERKKRTKRLKKKNENEEAIVFCFFLASFFELFCEL